MAATTYSGFWGADVNAYSPLVNKMPRRTGIKRIVNRDGFRALTALFNGLIGATTGGTVTASHTRVSHTGSGNSVGTLTSDLGKPAILSVSDINRVTTAADVAALKEMVYAVTERPVPYPRDLSGNGGPALS